LFFASIRGKSARTFIGMDAQYKIIGGDGREYGPASLDELKSWFRDGRAAGSTQIWREDLAIWAPAVSYCELADVVGIRPPLAKAGDEAIPVGFWARLAAYFVDMIILSLIFSAVWAIISAATGIKVPELDLSKLPPNLEAWSHAFSAYLDELKPVFWIYMLAGRTVHFIYDVCFNGRFGATPGKMLIGARIVRVDGSPLGYGLAALRWVAARVSDFTFGIGYLFIAVRPDKRALHDLLAGTKVVFKR
jgi:uncharacterized RDD family membrane protein YckC